MYLAVVFLFIFVCIDSTMVLRMDLVVGFAWKKVYKLLAGRWAGLRGTGKNLEQTVKDSRSSRCV